ncbi:MAG: hypothetical protein U0133_17735 [Gemmatimonadales bacterium]
MRLPFVAAAAAFALGMAPAQLRAQNVPLTPGKYDVTISGMPGGESENRPRCITADHLKNPESIFTYAFSATGKANPSVKVTTFTAQGGTLSYQAETPSSNIKVTGSLTSTGFSVERVTTSKSGKGQPITMKLEGKRTGACTH